ncbi:hypothetical protein HPB51_012312 [Rhipicephalus microplus]|uniref:Uncharacterized protein n=1 Tax=Rhipicephalus microplus TaxID=6941 RepID=A0A9J6D9U7_RHIMP|nr:hypothetical protein HPB51_012312 [Rhipicephalus microplus]
MACKTWEPNYGSVFEQSFLRLSRIRSPSSSPLAAIELVCKLGNCCINSWPRLPLGAKHGATAAPDRPGDGAPSAGSQPAALEKVSRAPYAAHLPPQRKRSAPMDEQCTHRCAQPRSRPLASRALQSVPLFPVHAASRAGGSFLLRTMGARVSHVARSARRLCRDASRRFRCSGAAASSHLQSLPSSATELE